MLSFYRISKGVISTQEPTEVLPYIINHGSWMDPSDEGCWKDVVAEVVRVVRIALLRLVFRVQVIAYCYYISLSVVFPILR